MEITSVNGALGKDDHCSLIYHSKSEYTPPNQRTSLAHPRSHGSGCVTHADMRLHLSEL